MIEYEILFFPTPSRRFGGARTYQIKAESIMAAYQAWSRDYPEGAAYYAKEGWGVSGPEVVLPNPANDGVKVVDVIHLTPKERRDAMKRKKDS